MMDDVDAFLAHHGVKGQRWGFRNKRNTSDHISKTRRKVVKGATVVGALTATAVVSSILSRKGMISVKEANRQTAERASQIRRVVDKALWQNPVHKNAAADLHAFVKRLQ